MARQASREPVYRLFIIIRMSLSGCVKIGGESTKRTAQPPPGPSDDSFVIWAGALPEEGKSHHADSNRGPKLYESFALPTELWWHARAGNGSPDRESGILTGVGTERNRPSIPPEVRRPVWLLD